MSATIPTVKTAEGEFPSFYYSRGREPSDLQVAENPQVGDLVLTHSRGNYRAVKVIKVGPKRVQVAYTTEGAVTEAQRIAEVNHVALFERNRAHALQVADRYERQAKLIEDLSIEVTEGRKYPEDPFVPLASLPREYALLDAEGGTNYARSTIVHSPEQLRAWAQSNRESYGEDKRAAAEAKDAVPFLERFEQAIHVTTKSVPREKVFEVA